MDAELDDDRRAGLLDMAFAVEGCDLALDVDGGLHRLGRGDEGRHDCIADGFDDGAFVVADDFCHEGKVIAHQVIGAGIADRLIERGRALEVAEQQGDAADRDLIARAQHVVGEEVAEGLQRRHAIGGQGVRDPASILDDRDQRPLRAVAEAQHA